jgi:hypothetical protein
MDCRPIPALRFALVCTGLRLRLRWPTLAYAGLRWRSWERWPTLAYAGLRLRLRWIVV